MVRHCKMGNRREYSAEIKRMVILIVLPMLGMLYSTQCEQEDGGGGLHGARVGC